MKFTKKCVLVPYEKYKRITSNQTTPQLETVKTSDKTSISKQCVNTNLQESAAKEFVQEKRSVKDKEKNIPQPRDNDVPQANTGNHDTITQHGNGDLQTTPPPPGIPMGKKRVRVLTDEKPRKQSKLDIWKLQWKTLT